MRKKMIIADSGLFRKTGHHYNQDMAIRDEAIRQGWDAEIYAHYSSPFEDTKAVFKDCLYDHKKAQVPADIIEDYISRGAMYDDILEADLVHFPTCNHIIVHGLSHMNIKAQKITMVVNLPGWMEQGGGTGLIGILYQHAMRKAKAKYPQLQFLANSQAHADQLTNLCGYKVELLESFLENAPNANKPNEKLVLGYFGHSNPVKGGHLLKQLPERFPQVDFLIHENPAGCLGLPKTDNLTIHKGELDPEVYLNTVNLCDILLLPYNAMYYSDCISNVALEGLVMGKVMVVPNYTEIQRMTGDSAVAFDNPNDFAASVGFAIQYHEELRKKALAKVKTMREKYDVRRYIKEVIGSLV